MDHLSDLSSNISRPFSHRKGQSPWPDVRQSLTPAQASATFSSLAQVSVLMPLLIYFLYNPVSVTSHSWAIISRSSISTRCVSFFSKLGICRQVQRVWCVRRRWGRRASPTALSCAPWTDILRMTGLNWVRFVHRPRTHTLRQDSLWQGSYVTDCRGAALLSGAKIRSSLGNSYTLHSRQMGGK